MSAPHTEKLWTSGSQGKVKRLQSRQWHVFDQMWSLLCVYWSCKWLFHSVHQKWCPNQEKTRLWKPIVTLTDCFSISKEWDDAHESCMNWWLQYCFSSYSSLYTISCFKGKSSPRGCLCFSSFVSSLSVSEWEGGSNSHKGDRAGVVDCWQSAKAKKCCTVWPAT